MLGVAPPSQRFRFFTQSSGTAYALLVIAVGIAYSNAPSNSFVYDDEFIIVKNQFLRSWHDVTLLFSTSLMSGSNMDGAYYRPLQTLFSLIIYQTFGPTPLAFHTVNIALHAANAALVYKLGRKLDFASGAVFLSTLLWAVHPVQSESVAYISDMADTLCALFCLTSVLILLPDFSLRRYLFAAPFIILALLSKEGAVALPLLAMSCLYFSHPKRFQLNSYLNATPAAIIVIIYAVVHFALPLHGLESATALVKVPSATSYTAFASLPLYGRLLLWPTGLHMEHDLPLLGSLFHGTVILGLLLLVACAIFVFKPQTRISLPISWGLLWFFAALFPVFDTDNLAYEHWLYLPSAGLILGLGQGANLALESRSQLFAFITKERLSFVVVLTAFLFAFLTYQRNFIWADNLTLYSDMVASGEPEVKAHTNLGSYYSHHQDYERAVNEFEIAIRNSGDTTAGAENDLGATLFMMSDVTHPNEKAQAHLMRALEIDPLYYPALISLATYYAAQGNTLQAAIYQGRADTLRIRFKTHSDIPASHSED